MLWWQYVISHIQNNDFVRALAIPRQGLWSSDDVNFAKCAELHVVITSYVVGVTCWESSHTIKSTLYDSKVTHCLAPAYCEGVSSSTLSDIAKYREIIVVSESLGLERVKEGQLDMQGWGYVF